MTSARGFAIWLTVFIVGALALLSMAEASAQDAEYIRPDRTDFGDTTSACPAGTSLLFVQPDAFRYCTAPSNYSPVTTQADCTAAGQAVGGFATWASTPTQSYCMGGGYFDPNGMTRPEVSPTFCGATYVQQIVIFGQPPQNACVVQLYKLNAPTTMPTPTPFNVPGTEFCPGSTTPVMDGLPNGGCPSASGPAAAPEPSPVPTAAPTPAPLPTIEVVPVDPPTSETPAPPAMPGEILTLATTAGDGLELEDPYNCGAGFFGDVGGGTPPYVLQYTIANSADTIDLGTFPVAGPGHYDSPPGFIDYSAVPDAVYEVSITISDSSAPPLSLTRANLFSAFITDYCPLPTPVPQPTAVFVPASSFTTGHLVTALYPPIGPAKPKASLPKELALTGIESQLAAWALWMIAIGLLTRWRSVHIDD